jgi:hypothetical protein
LGFLLKDLLDHGVDWNLQKTAYEHLRRTIISCGRRDKEHDALVELGLRYRNYLFLVCELHLTATESALTLHSPFQRRT